MDVADPGIEEIDITVAITCYNEEDYIVDTIETVIGALQEVGCSYEVLVIDDVSEDNSVNHIEEYIRNNHKYPIRLKKNRKNIGLANNFVEGAFLGKGKYYRLCCGDNAEPKESLVYLFKHIGKADIVIPYQKQSEIIGKSFLRKSLSKFFVFLFNVISGFNIKYYNGLQIFLRYNVMRWPPISYGFGFQADVVTRMLDEGASYVQIPTWGAIDRKGDGSVALSMRNVLSVAHTLLEVAFRRLRRFLYHKDMPKAVEVRLEVESKFSN